MINITISEAINGYHVSIFDWRDNSKHSEICEREIDAWEILLKHSARQAEKCLNRIKNSAIDVEI